MARKNAAQTQVQDQGQGTLSEESDANLFPDQESLAEAERMWGEGAEEAEKANPVGSLLMTIKSATFERSASGGRLQIHYHLSVDNGPNAGVEVDKYDGLGSPKQTMITQGQLKRLGLPTEKINLKNLPGHLLTLKDKQMLTQAKLNGEFYNITFVRPATSSVTRTPAAVGGGGAAPAGRKRGF